MHVVRYGAPFQHVLHMSMSWIQSFPRLYPRRDYAFPRLLALPLVGNTFIGFLACSP